MTRDRERTLGDLKASGQRPVPVKVEIRHNLMACIRQKKDVFPGIVGYGDTVIPQIENAILSGQDIIFLGERGQAKSRLMRSLVNLLDGEIPVLKGCEINDNPFAPICKHCRNRLLEQGDSVEIAWLPREKRYGEKLATPDITMADLIGDIDPIKIAEGRYLSDELAIHYGFIPRTNRGIFCINELPDLAERLQVGLLNVMQERDIQIRGYPVRLPLDIFLVASANPEDYTNRGRIITPLKDRFGAQVRTHYPTTIEDEIAIMEEERRRFEGDEFEVYVPGFIKEIIAEVTHFARKSPDINQSSGMSVRVSIANYETLISSAIRRAIVLNEKVAVPRISDLPAIHSSTTGKIELESLEETREGKVIDELIRKAVLEVFNRRYHLDELEGMVGQFRGGFCVEVSDTMSSKSYLRTAMEIMGFEAAIKNIGLPESPEATASAVEFVLEGLYLNRRLSKTEVSGKTIYRY